jgi:hypothetical protein
MSTIQTTLKRTPTRWPGTIVTTAGALITVAVVVLFLALAGGSRGHHAVSHPAPTYYPLIHYRGTGAPPASTAGTPPTTPAPGSPHKSYGAVP